MTPSDRKYTKNHEWVFIKGDVATVGITDHAQSELGDITYVELPDPESELVQREECGVVESVKAASDLFAPLSGIVSEINTKLDNHPESINEDPYGSGWMYRITGFSDDDVDTLLDADEYESMIGEDE